MFPMGTTTVTCSSTDTHGNTGSASFTVTVVSLATVVPVFVSEAISVTDTVTPALSVLVTVTEVISVTDSVSAVVIDLTPPVLAGLPGPLTTEATGPGGAIVKFPQLTASDPDDAAGPVTCAPASGAIFALGTTTVTCRSVDTHGNVGFASFPVTVVDTTPPALTLPSNMTVLPTSLAGAVVTFAAFATDLVSGVVVVTCAPASGSTFRIGSTSVACSARDGRGNEGTGGFSVAVLSPAQIAADIIADILASNFRQAVALIQDLIAMLERGNSAAGCEPLNAFITQVRAQAGKKLTVDQARRLIERAQALATVLGCRAPA
jgi:hypothetical protein